ncbi:MAG TPA: hypothetical protein VFP72_20980 [Kineosporiaceae bacterium]|nr:hypothetical protein [Kineosporiaceae bacterium]
MQGGPGGSGPVLTGGEVPEETLADLVRRLGEDSEPVLPRHALALTGRLQQAAVAVLGGLGLAILLIGVAELAGRFC